MTQTFIISAEEKALLNAAKRVCQQWGFINGKLITHKDHHAEAEALLIKQIECGRFVVNGQYLCGDLTK